MNAARSLRTRFEERTQAEFAAQPLLPQRLVTESDLSALPDPVQRFLRRSGAVGRPRPQNVRVEYDALMWRARDAKAMVAPSVQYNFFGRPARIFLMEARMFGLPVRALHVYSHEQATFTVRIASMINKVDVTGVEISRTETVTLLNDMCFIVPGTLVDERLSWRSLDDRSAAVTFRNGPHQVQATLLFNALDELVDFQSDDRPASQDDGSFLPVRWRTPVMDYREIDGYRLPTRGDAIYEYPEGPLRYGRFTLRSVAYDLADPQQPSHPLALAQTP